MLDKLNLQPVKEMNPDENLFKGLPRVCNLKVDKLQSGFLFGEGFSSFFSQDNQHKANNQLITLRMDVESNTLAITASGHDGTKHTDGILPSLTTLSAPRLIADLNLKAGATLTLYQATKHTLLCSIKGEHLVDDPYEAFITFIDKAAEVIHKDKAKHCYLRNALERLTGRDYANTGDRNLISVTARRILRDVRVSQGLRTNLVADYPTDVLKLVEAATDLALDGYTRVKTPNVAGAMPQVRVCLGSIDKLISAVNETFGTSLTGNPHSNTAKAYHELILPKLPELAPVMTLKEDTEKPTPTEEDPRTGEGGTATLDKAKDAQPVLISDKLEKITLDSLKTKATQLPTLGQVSRKLYDQLKSAGANVNPETRDIILPIRAEILNTAYTMVNDSPSYGTLTMRDAAIEVAEAYAVVYRNWLDSGYDMPSGSDMPSEVGITFKTLVAAIYLCDLRSAGFKEATKLVTHLSSLDA